LQQLDLTSAIAHYVAEGIYTVDSQGRITFLNPAAETMLGWTQAELIERPAHEAIHFQDAHGAPIPARACRLLEVLRTRDTLLDHEDVFTRKDGTRFPVVCSSAAVYNNGHIDGAVVAFHDITERQVVERRHAARLAVTQALAESATVSEATQRILAALGESLDYGVGAFWQVDREAHLLRRAGCWHKATSAFPRFEAISRESAFALGIGLPGRIWASRRPAWIRDVTRDNNFPRLATAALEGLHGAFGFPVLLGQEVLGVVEFFCKHVREPDPELLEIMGTVGSQIGQFMARQAEEAERKRLQEALGQRATQLAEADRHKDEFLAMLAHELRTPLAPMRNALQILRLREMPDPIMRQARDIIDRQVRHMSRLVEDLLDVSRISRGKVRLRREHVELRKVVDLAVETTRPQIDKRQHQLTVLLPPEPLWLEADPVRVEQILANLLDNAAKYMDPGGRIWLTAERGQRAPGAPAEVWLRVRDTGIGITPEMRARIFDLFAQVDKSLDRAQGGLGIGLTLVRLLVQMHGGSIEVHSDGPGKGSEFTVRLPLDTRPTPAPAPARPATQAPAQPPQAHRVLVVDDNKDGAESLALMLRLWGHQASLAFDGPGALTAVETYRPEAVFLDIGLPGMDGYQVAKCLRQRRGFDGMVLVALTGYGQDEDRRRSSEAGFNYHLVKPVDLDALETILQTLPAGNGA
jgi:PAS domain S-box-containing protein